MLLGDAGATIVKIESTRRPDGARRGPQPFYDLLHAGHRSVALDFDDPHDRARLRALVDRADVVIEASRPRALAALGLDAVAAAEQGTVWLSITGYGRHGFDGLRVAFGDDAAVVGGLVAGSRQSPCFLADAVADPLTGLVAAAAAIDCPVASHGALVDVSMAGVAAWCARDARPDASWDVPGEPSRRRPDSGRAAELGVDTNTTLRELTGA